MILYCDTSALVKLYVAEPHRERVAAGAEAAEAVATSRIAWAEFHAATARREREVLADAAAMEQARQLLAADWHRYVVMEVAQRVVERAGEYADAFALRGYDAVHLASAAEAADRSGREVCFACFEKRLNKAAGLLRLKTLSDR